ncbi:MAG: UvrD-helicase domain-containing protein [Thermodesulfovibrio sp.]|nr:UvrD-helicase domain-containing protein [Thermodesulfovibrio sp.]
MENNSELQFPHYVILKASAGSGKTTALTERFVYFLLSDNIPNNSLKNILAITFSNNASYEMKARIIEWLKNLYFKEQNSLNRFSELLKMPSQELSIKAGEVLDEILDNYSDFQVKTIDSFMTSIFKASAIDFDYNPDFEILMNNQSLMRYSYDLFLKDVEENSVKADFFENIIEIISSNSKTYLWNPADLIFYEIKDLYSKIYSNYKEFIISDEDIDKKRNFEVKLYEIMKAIREEIKDSGLDINRSTNILDVFDRITENRNFIELLEKGFKKPPVNKPKKLNLMDKYEKIIALWEDFNDTLSRYALYYALTFYAPYLKVYQGFRSLLDQIKQKECKIFIEDINKILSNFLNDFIIPDIYFRLGEKIHHFFIDEYQDTSPLQWNNIKFLVENALSEFGSLFVVGDTKQAIYNFRGADYKIMKKLEQENLFPSAKKIVKTLSRNYRSKKLIIDFIGTVFKEKISKHPIYGEPARATGLNECEQTVEDESSDKGYIEIKIFGEEEEEEINIKKYLDEIIKDALNRGYLLKDIAILAFKNEQVVNISQWLNDLQLPFISYSSLDVRKRKVTSEILSFLQFLDSPMDDFAFSNFLLSEIFKKLVTKEGLDFSSDEFLLKYRDKSPLYKAFEKECPHIWDKYFRQLFRLSGYLPVYDMFSVVLDTFKVFETMPEEEATFFKLLEVVKIFEDKGYSNIKELVEFFEGTGEDDSIWNINLGADIDAIQVMTIHKAKGLGFPIVVVYLKNENIRPNRYVFYESEEGVSILKITNKIAEKNQFLFQLKDELKKSEFAEMLNTLYVAFTRAEDELYILCRSNNRDKFPFDILSEWFDIKIGNKLKKDRSIHSFKPSKLQIQHYPISFDFSVKEEKLHFAEKLRGEFIHKVLENIECFEENNLEKLNEKIEILNREFHSSFSALEIKSLIFDMINNPEMKKFFKSNYEKVFNELEVIDKNGNIHRIDRVLEDRENVIVIEYKTGFPKDEHFLQLRLYMNILSEIFRNKKIIGYLYYIDLREVKKIE